MTVSEAKNIIKAYYGIGNPTKEDDFRFTEACEFVIREDKDSRIMMQLGGWYYGNKEYDLALKYYEMAESYNNPDAYGCLGYIWYYGRTGQVDYDKAFRYYSLSAENGNLESAYKVADMYKNGYSVEKDYGKYKSIIEDLYDKVKNDTYLFAPVPQICIRLARIRKSDGEPEEAVSLLFYAKDFLAQRLKVNHFFGDLTSMSWLISELYDIYPFDESDFDFYDLYYLLKRPCKVSFLFEGDSYTIEATEEEGETVIHFGDKWYRSVSDFFNKANLKGYRLTEICNYLENFEVV